MDRRRIITYLLIVNAILALFAVISRVGLLLEDKAPENWEGDFISFYTGWTMVNQGQGPELYNLETQTKLQQSMLEGRVFSDANGVLPFINPPHSVFPFLPLAWLPRHTAFLVWQIINLGVLGWVIWAILNTMARDWSKHERWAIVLIPLAFTPLLLTFMLGTFSLIVTACFVAALIAFERGQDVRGAAWLFIASIKFPLLILIAVALLISRRWRAILTGIILAGIAFTLTGLVLGFSVWSDYFALAGRLNTFINQYGIYPHVMPNLKGLIATILGKNPFPPLLQALSTAGLVIGASEIGRLMIRGWYPERVDWKLKMGFMIALSVFLALHLNEHDALLFLVATLMVYAGIRQSGTSEHLQHVGGFLLLCPLLFAILPVWGLIILQIGFIGWVAWLIRQHTTESILSAI